MPKYSDEDIRQALAAHGGSVWKAWQSLSGRKTRPGDNFRDRCRRVAADDPKPPAPVEPVADRLHVDLPRPDKSARAHVSSVRGRVLILSDVHAPYHDRRAWDALIQSARLLRPDVVVINGDFLDCYAVSSHSKDPKRRANMAWEIEQAATLLAELTDATLGAERWYTEGNHEHRLPRYIADKAPEVDGMVRTIQEALRLGEHNWRWVDAHSWLDVGKMAITHGWRCGKYCLPQSVQEWGGCVAVGHSHRLGVWYAGDVRGDDHVGINTGWLGDIESIYYRYRATAEREWQHGFGVVEVEDDGFVFAHVVPIVAGRTRIGVRRVVAK